LLFDWLWLWFLFNVRLQATQEARCAGEDFALGTKAALTEVRGDWKFIHELFQMKVGYRNQQICHHCHARRIGNFLNYTDFGPDAAWVGTRRTHADFLLYCIPQVNPCDLLCDMIRANPCAFLNIL
jgi:hypothetical protein